MIQIHPCASIAYAETSAVVRVDLQERTTYAAIFRGGYDSYLQVVALSDWDFDSKGMTVTNLDALRDSSTETHAIYPVDTREEEDVCHLILFVEKHLLCFERPASSRSSPLCHVSVSLVSVRCQFAQ